MKDLPTTWKRGFSQSLLWFAVAAAVIITAAGTAVIPRAAWANSHDPPKLTAVFCHSDGNIMLWRTGNDGQVEAPEGWKVERTHRSSQGNSFVQTFTFIGSEADDLLTVNQDRWLWTDTSADRNLPYTYRVRATNADGSDMDGSTWSRSFAVDCFANTSEEPGISLPVRQDNAIAMLWRTKNGGQEGSPEGWKVERTLLDPEGTDVVQIFTFTGADADALLTYDDRYWEWVDTSADRNVEYTDRVRAINSDGSDMDGRNWSRSVSPNRLQGPLDQPGVSVPRCQDNGVSMFWHTSNRGQDVAPDGWKVERRHRDSDGLVVQTFTFTGAQADALQTFNDEYWDWVDTTADPGVAYTYRVRAINSDGSYMSGRAWSRRAPVECGPVVA